MKYIDYAYPVLARLFIVITLGAWLIVAGNWLAGVAA